MDKLLQWSIAQQTGDKEAMEQIGQPDPRMLDQLFGGPDEPTLMKQAVMVLDNPKATEENKFVALENFEMLIENLDNANNIENMKLWPSIVAQLSNSNPDFQALAASIIGIATQNNPNSQEAFLKHEDGLGKLVRLLRNPSVLPDVLLKVLFAASSLVRNNPKACEAFVAFDGWKHLNIQDLENHRLLLRKLSLVSALLSCGLDETTRAHIRNDKVVDRIAVVLVADRHLGCIDKALSIIAALKREGYEFSDEELSRLSEGLKNVEDVEHLSAEEYEAAKKAILQ